MKHAAVIATLIGIVVGAAVALLTTKLTISQQRKADATVDQEAKAAKSVVNKAFENDMVSGKTLRTFKAVKNILVVGSNLRTRVLRHCLQAIKRQTNSVSNQEVHQVFQTGFREIPVFHESLYAQPGSSLKLESVKKEVSWPQLLNVVG
jgi:mannitol-specific phosphotransferase system IIBC component